MEQIMIKLLNNFDFGYMLTINILTYILIKIFNKQKETSLLLKRLLLLCSIALITIIYEIIGYDNNIILVNSAILAPVSWSWIFKPIINKFKNKNNVKNNKS